MPQLQIPAVNGGIQVSDSAATANAIAQRDSNADCNYRRVALSGGLDNSGGQTVGLQSKTSSFSADNTKVLTKCDTTSGSITATLPAAALSSGLRLTFIKTDSSANSLIIDGNAAETINGAATWTSAGQYSSITVICDGTGWFIESQKGTWA